MKHPLWDSVCTSIIDTQHPRESTFRGVIKSYVLRGFVVRYILVDIQFKGMETRFSTDHITVNVVSWDEHVSDAERYIRAIKERARAYFAAVHRDSISNNIESHGIQSWISKPYKRPWMGSHLLAHNSTL